MHYLSLKKYFWPTTHMILERIMRGFILTMFSIFIFLSSSGLDAKTSQAQEVGIAQLQHLAEQGNVEAQYDLGMAYIKGQSVQKNYQIAKEWLEKSAMQDYPGALGFLGVMYQNGLGVEKNYAKAMDFLNRAASKGNIDAMASLGQMYSDGEGVERNYSKAVEYLKPAANAGNWGAQYTLGAMYADGRGVPQDYVEAHKWFNILAAVGFEQVVEVRNRLAKKMTLNQIAEAQQLAREWKPVLLESSR